MSEQIFPEGMRLWPPHEKAPTFIKGNLSVHVVTFTEWAQQHVDAKGFVKLDLKEGFDTKLYLALNQWKPTKPSEEQPTEQRQDAQPDSDSEIPF
jgi:hypothetical protein